MHKAMIVALAALATLLLMPPPGSAREPRHQGSHSQGSYSQRSASPGSFQRGTQPRSFSSQRSFTRHDGYRGTYSPREYYRSGGYPYRSYRHGGYPYHRSNVHFSGSVWLGPGWYSGWGWPYSHPYYYPYYYPYYAAPPVVIEQAPTEYIEKDQEAEETNYLYRCSDPEGYYPTVQRCPSGWSKEIPSAPPDQ